MVVDLRLPFLYLWRAAVLLEAVLLELRNGNLPPDSPVLARTHGEAVEWIDSARGLLA